MKIIVTGALGHIGSKLIRDLPLNFQDLEILMLDNFTTQRYTSLFNLPNSAKYSFHQIDIIKDSLDEIFKDTDIVVHLAALTEASTSIEKPEEYERVNYNATRNILEVCKKYSLKLIHLSTTSIYGTKKKIVDENCDEEDIKPQSPYALTKFKEEKLVQEYFEKGFVKTKTLRLGSICGISPGMRFHAAISKFCYQASTGRALSVWKTAINQKRPYLNINDATGAISFIIEKNLFDGGVYNLVTSNSSVQEIIDLIKKKINKVKIEIVDNKIMNDFSYDVSAQKIKDEGFKFTGTIEQGINDTIDLFNSLKDNFK
tara:strand:- start:1937 stop:2881 length:945 start_codon:yes stop_codon:yes gene_type:complete